MAASDDRALQVQIDPGDPRQLQHVLLDIGTQVEPSQALKLTTGTQATLTRRVRILVTDRLGQEWTRPWLLHVYIAATSGGVPGGTQTVALVTGTALLTIQPNIEWWFLATSGGVVELDVTLPAAGTRYIYAESMGRANRGSLAAAYA